MDEIRRQIGGAMTRTKEYDQAKNDQPQPPALAEALLNVAAHVENPKQGLPEEVFLFVSSLTPMVNVDLLVRDPTGRILLSWRDDDLSGRGWHVPGGIIRFGERREERLRKTALQELGCEVHFDPLPLECIEFFLEQGGPRGHFITFVYACRLPDGVVPLRLHQERRKHESGDLAWHDVLPDNTIPAHRLYGRYFSSDIKGENQSRHTS